LTSASPRARYLAAYARLREREGRGSGGEAELLALPYVTEGPLAPQWEVRARTYDVFARDILAPLAERLARPVRLLDLGAGNGWLSYRAVLLGHAAIALDVRMDAVDGLAAAAGYAAHLPRLFQRLAASFDDLPLASRSVDLAVFDASLHYAGTLDAALREAVRVVASGGTITILDSPFYEREEDGRAMLAERDRTTRERFPDLAEDLLAVPMIEYLTTDGLTRAGAPLGLEFVRHPVVYPEWYEARFEKARRDGGRAPSRFDLWDARVP
jgi:SAM-dependent methyltransferase